MSESSPPPKKKRWRWVFGVLGLGALGVAAMSSSAETLMPLEPSNKVTTFKETQAAISDQTASQPAVTPKCPSGYADPVRIKVGGTEFHIPDYFKPDLVNEYGKPKAPLRKFPCYDQKQEGTRILAARMGFYQESTDPPFEVDTIFFSTVALRGAVSAERYKQYKILENLDIKIMKSYESSQIFFCKRKQEADQSIGKWKKYSRNEDFEEGEELKSLTMPNGVIYYYSPTVKFFGMPVLIKCSRKNINLGMAMDGRSCHLVTAAGEDNYIIVRLYDESLPPEKWNDVIKKLESFIQLISLRSITPEKPDRCKNIPTKGE